MSKLTVGRIDDQGDRVLLYASAKPTYSRLGEYHIIAPAHSAIKVGDVVEYEEYGFNFGWLTPAPAASAADRRDGGDA